MDLIQILPVAPTAALIFFKTEITIKEENSKENSSPGSPIAFSFHVSWVSLNRGQCLSLFGFFFFPDLHFLKSISQLFCAVITWFYLMFPLDYIVSENAAQHLIDIYSGVNGLHFCGRNAT